jgi:hypothetical protein
MFIAALFTIAKLCDVPLLMSGLRKCGIYLYTMEFYSAIKKNEILSFAGK